MGRSQVGLAPQIPPIRQVDLATRPTTKVVGAILLAVLYISRFVPVATIATGRPRSYYMSFSEE
jgi:hypothetical protein